jgi:Phosphate-selective porin O and P
MSRLVADRGPDRLAADHALQTHASISRSTVQRGDVKAHALQLPPDLAHAIDLEILRKDTGDRLLQRHIPPRSHGELQAQVYSVEAAGTYGPLFFQGEYYWYNVERGVVPGLTSLNFDGGYAQASYVLTGETHTYNSAVAAYNGIVPANPFSLMSGGWARGRLPAASA